ncbi:LicD family protein [Cytophagaceae bacterium YF14B1]|uniref:LicD family protein n=1 Tax=Xanthocytophaga flava TaxID=3048013 RepID=A0AAE3U812_9BACT|nr:LicD family protein [Xanthocytophaga flavus]MDJ1480708.1 LicD family protein [Xanthocytophaga flavus]
MRIYQIRLNHRGIKSVSSINSLKNYEEELHLIEGCDPNFESFEEIEIDKEFMLHEYGFPISDAEIACFISHKRVWQEFEKSSYEWCLIMEDDALIYTNKEIILEMIQELPDDWELFYPYEKSIININFKNYQPYAMGLQWGAYAYFLHKRGLKKVLGLNCKQPVDDELITLCMDKVIKGYFSDTNYFETDSNISYIKSDRQKLIRDSMLDINLWNSDDKELIRKLLKIISTIGNELDIKLILEGGTLLGYVRHGMIIPWDDDVDIAINELEIKLFLDALTFNHSNVIEYDLFHEEKGCKFYKIWLKEGYSIPNCHHKWPFIDIWMLKEVNNHITLDSVGKKGLAIKEEDFFPLKEVVFEESIFFIPKNYFSILSFQYPNWRTEMRIYPYSHRLEKSGLKPLVTSITVNNNGRILL